MDLYGARAGLYERHRWPYDDAALDLAIRVAGLGPRSCVVDLGAGTGMLSRHFLSRVGTVYAVDPSQTMLSVAVGRYPALRPILASASATGLPAASVDCITVGRALHWFEPETARQEFRRLLRSGGWLLVAGTPPTRRLWPFPHPNRLPFHLGENYLSWRYPGRIVESWEEFWGRVQSFAWSPAPGADGHEQHRQAMRALFEEHASEGRLTVEYFTEVFLQQLH